MTKKDYELIAEAIKAAISYEESWVDSVTGKRAVSGVAFNLADSLVAENPRFNRALFLTACGIYK